ncbi:MAG: hypothetical protein QF719_03240 [Chloroflexota bacterium]|nr:hypothetical protein [Chloroflexota bacterium]MDP6757215.1 hypothetical protein [Chloroflexota bacterium]
MFWKIATGVLALATIAGIVLGTRFFMERDELAERMDLLERAVEGQERLSGLTDIGPGGLTVVGFRAEYDSDRSPLEQICATYSLQDGTQEACIIHWRLSGPVEGNALICAQRMELLKPLLACLRSPIVTITD